MLKTRKDILLIVLTFLATALATAGGTTIQGISNANWNLPKGIIAIAIIGYLAVLIALIFSIFWVLRGINTIDKQEENENIEDKAKINAILNKLNVTYLEIEKSKSEIIAKTQTPKKESPKN